ncbi:MAG: Bacterial regulatory proteins, gntR family [Lentisphaerae bacterium ADurb.Bin242]|nr:MAG: Bacterial regulatory proteins, gntR family [Lentisphaerae bacterium ADurb.Bin242]
MPLPSKQNELYERILDDMRRNYYPGALLPSEPGYAESMGIGRSTLRKVLTRLEAEKKIQRTHSGTYVLDEATGTCPKFQSTERPVYVLLPCSNYMDAIDKYSLDITRQFISGAMRAAVETGRQIVTLPVSETNRDNSVECIDIAWSQLSILRKNDNVIFLGRWFKRIVPFLAQTGCRTAYISQYPKPFPWLIKRNVPHFGYVGYSNTAFIEPAVEVMRKNGVRKIGCLWFSLEPEERTVVERSFAESLRKAGLDGTIADIDFHASAVEKQRRLGQFCSRNKFDGLIICPHLRDTGWNMPENPAVLKELFLVMDARGAEWLPACARKTVLGANSVFDVSYNIAKKLLVSEKLAATENYPYVFMSQSREM